MAATLKRCLGAWRYQPLIFPAVIVVASFNPANSIRRRHYFFQHLSSLPSPRSPTSLDLSTPDSPSTHGSSAVRSVKPLPLLSQDNKLQLLSFYHFIPISEPENLRDIIFERLRTIERLRGTVYVAKEGINAQFAVPKGDLGALLQCFGSDGCLPFDTFQNNPPNMGIVVDSDTPTFDKLVVRTRDFILRDGLSLNGEEGKESLLNWDDAGIELEASEWDEQLRRPDVQLLDCRNVYESDQGSFMSAKPLNTTTFSETWSVLDSEVKSKSIDPEQPVFIYCTGGIRCVKVGAYLRQRHGFEDVRSLKHGIIGYERWSEEVSAAECKTGGEEGDVDENNRKEKNSLWVGENFVFDKRRDGS